MKRLMTSIAAMATVLVATSGFAVAGGGHHHHSGIHVHVGSGYGLHSYRGSGFGHYGGGYGLSSSYGHHHYPSYGYSNYSYPRYYSSYPGYGSTLSYGYYPSYNSYRSYSYYPSYRSPTTCSPSVTYSRPIVRTYVPDQQQSDEQYLRPEVGPTPPAVPTENLPNPDSTQRPASVRQFASVTLGQPATYQRSALSQTPVALRAAVPIDDLGPRLATPASRRVVSDDESPWVVDESTFPASETNGKIAATSP